MGIAILIFTLVIKLAMLPIYIKQQKNTAKSAIFAPKVREIQQKYKNNQQKQQEELQKLQQQGYNPMGGCGSMILTMLLLFGVLDVVYRPMAHIVRVPNEKTASIIEESYDIELTSILVKEINNTAELKGDALTRHEHLVADAEQILKYYNENCLAAGEAAKEMSVFASVTEESKDVIHAAITTAMKNEYAKDTKYVLFTDTDLYKITDEENQEMKALATESEKAAYKSAHSLSDKMREVLSTLQSHFGSYKVTDNDVVTFQATQSLQRELYALETFGTGLNRDAYATNVIGTELKAELVELYDNLNFLGIPLGQVPWDNMGFPMIMIPILAFVFSVIQTIIANKNMERNNGGAEMAMSMKVTMWIMPVFSIFLVFTVPAGAGFYWTISYAFSIVQTLVLNKLYNPEKLRAQAEAEYEESMKRVKVQASRVRDTDNDNSVVEVNGEKISQKELNRRRLAEARRQDAIKYGEEYNEDDD